MFRLLIALPLLATFFLPLPPWSAPTPVDPDTDWVQLKGGHAADPSG